MIRFIITLIFLILFAILCIIILPLEALIGLFSKKARSYSSYWIVQHVFKLLIFLSGAKVNIKGLENIPKDVPVLYIGNHRSFWDIVISYSVVPPLTGYISKKEVKKVFGLNIWMIFMNCLFLDRTNPKEGIKTILSAIEHIKNGISIFIFPEGTRAHTDDELREFKEGSFKIAQRTNCPVIPVSFNNTSAIFEDHFPLIKKASVTIEFGKPVIPSELEGDDKKFMGTYFHSIIKTMVERNKVQ